MKPKKKTQARGRKARPAKKTPAQARPRPHRDPKPAPARAAAAKPPPPAPPQRPAGPPPADERYSAHREQAARRQAKISKSGRDIGPPPPVADPQRRQRGRESFEFFCRAYFPEKFSLPWSEDHRKILALIERVTIEGGQHAYAMPRGSGKTSLAETAALWAALYGLRQFPVVIGSDAGAAGELLDTIKTELECNELLAEDFPEVCYPIARLEGIAHRANGQLCQGQRTHIYWTDREIVLPTVSVPADWGLPPAARRTKPASGPLPPPIQSAASGVIIKVTGIEGRIRGMKFARPGDGRSVRPDLVILDDPQTDESARSPSQNTKRERTVAGAVLGLAGPGKKIAAIMPCTVIAPDDMADRTLSRERHPEWQGERTRMLYSFPRREELWQQYDRIRRDSLAAGNGGREATEFYRANREAMDEGARAAWPVRHHPDELSAIQHAMNLKLQDERAFMAEYQNEPLPEVAESTGALSVEQILAKVVRLKRGIVPDTASRLTAFIDVHKEALYWLVLGVEEDFTGHVVDYGTWPAQPRDHFQLRDVKLTLTMAAGKTLGRPAAQVSDEEAIYAGLEACTDHLLGRDWLKADGAPLRIERCPIDANWGPQTGLVYRFIRESRHAAVLLPSHGVGIKATGRPITDPKKKPGERVGDNWRLGPNQAQRNARALRFDANHWKTFAAARLAVGQGGRGCYTLFGAGAPADRQTHQLIGEHWTAETPVPVTARERTVIEWINPPAKPDQHWWDCLVGATVAASVLGVSLKQAQATAPAKKARVKLSDLQRKKWYGQG